MSTGMGVTNPKLAKSGRMLKKAKHYTIPKTLRTNWKERSFLIEGTELKVDSGKRKSHSGEYVKDAPNQVWGCLKDVFSRKIKVDKFEGKMLNSTCTLDELEP